MTVHDQAQGLRDLAAKRRPTALTVAVTSGKGGVGKSNVAVNLSICLAANSHRVTLVDVDMGLANADLLMNLQPRYTLSHVLSGVRMLEEVIMEGPAGLSFVPGTNGIHQWANLSDFERQNLLHQIHKLDINTDIVVLDCGAGLSANVLSFALDMDRVLIVTTPQPTALTDAYATIKTLRLQEYRGEMSVLVNMARSRTEAAAAFQRLSSVAKRFLGYPVASAGYLLQDTAVELAVRERCPFVLRFPGSNASACIAAVAADLARACPSRDRRTSLLRRVVGLFA